MNVSKIAFSPVALVRSLIINSEMVPAADVSGFTGCGQGVLSLPRFGVCLLLPCHLMGKECEDSLNLTNYIFLQAWKRERKREGWMETLIPTQPVTNLPFINKEKTCHKECREGPGRREGKGMVLFVECSLQAFICREWILAVCVQCWRIRTATKIERALVVRFLCALNIPIGMQGPSSLPRLIQSTFVVLSKIFYSFQTYIFQNTVYSNGLAAAGSPQSLALCLCIWAPMRILSAVGAWGNGNGATATSSLGFFTLQNFMHMKCCD